MSEIPAPPGPDTDSGPDTDTGSGSGSGSKQTRPATDVRLIQGRLSGVELAAITVVVSAMSVTSRIEAHERALAEGADDAGSAWMDPVHRLPAGHVLRGAASPSAWQFSAR